jgi:hypothetical protein
MEIVTSRDPNSSMYEVYVAGQRVGVVQSLSVKAEPGNFMSMELSLALFGTDITGLNRAFDTSATPLPQNVTPTTIEELVEEHRKLSV